MEIYKISSERRKYIESMFFEWSFGNPDEFLPEKNKFLNISHPAELHFLAYIYNWDDDIIVLKWILESEHCSRATANLIFWRSLPSYFEDSDFSDPSTCPEFCEPGFSLVPLVLERYKKNDFSPIEIAFNPKGEMEPVSIRSGKWEIPPGVYDEIYGLQVHVEEST